LAPAGAKSRVVRVAVLSRHQLIRAGLTQLLSCDNSRALVVAGPVGAGDLEGVDVVVFDLVADLGGHLDPVPEELAVLLAERVSVLAVTSHGKSHLAETALAMGVAEVVHLDVAGEALLQAVERVAAGHATTLVAYRGRHNDLAWVEANLTEREIAVLELVGVGLLNQDIADRLYLSINTVKTYIRSTYRKIGATRRAEAVLWAVHHGVAPRPHGIPV